MVGRLAWVLSAVVFAVPVMACSSSSSDGEDDVEGATESGEAITSTVEVGSLLRATSNVNLRAEATTASTRIRTITTGETVTALDARPTNGFYHVKHRETEGWVYGRYVTRATATGSEDPEQGSYEHSRATKLVYQGSCDFLHRCDSFSRRLPEGQVNWGCLGHGDACVDSEHWLSGPSHSYCGKTVKICKGSTCTTGKIMDVSVTQSFEASQGVLSALGIGFGGGSTCSNTYVDGDPRVTVYY